MGFYTLDIFPNILHNKNMNHDTRLEIVKERDFRIFKANEIIQKARYDLDILELKIMAYVFSKIKPDDKENTAYEFSVKDYCQVCGIDYKSGGNYDYIKTTVKGLRDKSFWIVDEKGSDILIGWLSNVKMSRGDGKMLVKLDENLQHFLLGLISNYTQYAFLSTIPMKSAYSFRMYELIKSYSYSGKSDRHTFDVETLKAQLMCHYANFKDFRVKVLEVATREINLYTDIEVSWKPITKGRKVIQVEFYIKQRDTWGSFFASGRATKAIEGQMDLESYYRN